MPGYPLPMMYFPESGAPSTWNPLDKASLIVLSNGDLDAAKPSGDANWLNGSVRGTQGKTTGLLYFTVTATVADPNLVLIGIADSDCSLTASYIGDFTTASVRKSISVWSRSDIYWNFTAADLGEEVGITHYGNGTVVGVLVDFTARTVTFYNDSTGVALGSPRSATDPWAVPMFPAATLWVGGSVTNLNCAGPFGNLPASASPWDS